MRSFLKRPSSRKSRWSALLLTAGLLSSAWLVAFPPAPYYILFGVVRDQVGTALNVEGADVILLKDGVEIGRTPVISNLRLDSNYELNISIEQARADTRSYSDRSVDRLGVFSLAVEMNGETFYPIEADGTLRAGEGGERVRLDLNIGADANNDGLPDAWQEWQLYQAGFRPGDAAYDIDQITRDGDYDGDGTSNFLEYVAGTFATDSAERFELIITGRTESLVSFEFFSITGKVYAIEASTDLEEWEQVPMMMSPTGEPLLYFRATAVDILSAYVATEPGTQRFYRITVR